MVLNLAPELSARSIAINAIGRLADQTEIASIAAFLLSPDASGGWK